VHRKYSKWKEATKMLRRSLAQSQLTMPDGSLALAYNTDELEALERTARLCQRSGFANHADWLSAFEAHLVLWRSSVALSLDEGFIKISLKDTAHPDADDFAGLVDLHASLKEIPGHKWLATQRGIKAGILASSVELPWDKIRAQTVARLGMLGLAAEKRGADSIVEELIANDLENAITRSLTQRAEDEAFSAARTAYLGLLNTPPLQATKALSVFVGSEAVPTGVAVLDRRGDIIEHQEVQKGDDLAAVIKKLIEEHQPEAAILPLSSSDSERLGTAEEALSGIPVQRVHDIALQEARKNVSLDKAEASAIILARRALKPGREWGRVDPLSLKLGEYTRETDEDRMREILSEAKALSSWDRRKRNKAPNKKVKFGGRFGATLPSGKRLNPFLKSIRDLRPGMTLDGIITNLTRFGAFVNIGLQIEGMIHVSQLSIEFVEDPSQVVRVGEQVKARVLEVVPEKQRIALSLKPPPETGKPDVRTPPQGGDQPRGNRAPPKTRSAALADLDALFKK
jgi:transcriptional accessory protein Tex/SPT6